MVGGGVHGVHLAIRLLDAGLASTETLALLDPGARPLEAWLCRAERIGMDYLRSPIAHHLAPRPQDLGRFLKRDRPLLRRPATRGPNRRPSLELFQAHACHLMEQFELDIVWRRGRAVGLGPSEHGLGWAVQTDAGTSFTAASVVLALGADGALAWPGWAGPGAVDPRVSHLLSAEGVVEDPQPGERVAIVGGGLTAAQAAVRWAEGGADVTVLARHPVRVARYDTDSGWLGPKHMRAFWHLSSPRRRREVIDAARNRGTMTSEVARRLHLLRAEGAVRWDCVDVRSLEASASEVSLTLRPVDAGGPLREQSFRRILLATGSGPARPGGAWLDRAAGLAGLPVAPCGFPVPDSFLRWAPGLYVTGALAELVVGPVARNIAGAQRCADRILASFARRSPGVRATAVGSRSALSPRGVGQGFQEPELMPGDDARVQHRD